MLPEIHEAKLRKIWSYVSELGEVASMIEMPQHAKEVASMTLCHLNKCTYFANDCTNCQKAAG